LPACWDGDLNSHQAFKDDSIKTEGIITERVPLSDVVKGGFEELVAHSDRHIKILADSSG
jgi:(R,R)-butanediol dehydrogenase / meso-butanediol dehydrogenase / diacetyl reductase